MKEATIVFCLKYVDDILYILLGYKKRGFGKGKYNGYGGKLEVGETPDIAAVRELQEESHLVAKVEDLKYAAILYGSVYRCHVYLLHNWDGEYPIETEEMSPHWFPYSQIPWHMMWESDSVYIRRIIAGEQLRVFALDGQPVICNPLVL